MNNIIDYLAPQKTVNLKKNYAPYLNQDLREEIKKNNLLLTKTISSKDKNDWRQYRHEKISLNKKIDEAKKVYLKDKLGNPHKGWKLLNEFKGNNKAHPLSKLIYKNKIISRPNEIANIQNQFYVKKIQNISKSFNKSKMTPI